MSNLKNAQTVPPTDPMTPQPCRVHQLKTWPQYFDVILSGEKTFEIRRNDRGFAVGDVLMLYEFEPGRKFMSGRECVRVVTYITDFAQQPGYVVMGIKNGPSMKLEKGRS